MSGVFSKLYEKIRNLLFIKQEIKVEVCDNKHCEKASSVKTGNRDKIDTMWK